MARSHSLPASPRLCRRGSASARTPSPAARAQSNPPSGTVAAAATDPATVAATVAAHPTAAAADSAAAAGPATVAAETDEATVEELRREYHDLREQLAAATQKCAAEAASSPLHVRPPPPLPNLVADADAVRDSSCDAAAAAASAAALFASCGVEPTLRYWMARNVPGTVSLATVGEELGVVVVDRMLDMARVVVATLTPDAPCADRLNATTGADVAVVPYRPRSPLPPAALRTTSDVVIVHCVAEAVPTLDSALRTLHCVGFPLHHACRLFLPRSPRNARKTRPLSRHVHQVYVQMASVDAAQAVCPRSVGHSLPLWDAVCDAVTGTHVHVLQLARDGFNAARSGEVAVPCRDGVWRKWCQENGRGVAVGCFESPVASVVPAAWVEAEAEAAVEAEVEAEPTEVAPQHSEAQEEGAVGSLGPPALTQSLPAWRDYVLTTFEESASPSANLAMTLPDAVWEGAAGDGDSLGSAEVRGSGSSSDDASSSVESVTVGTQTVEGGAEFGDFLAQRLKIWKPIWEKRAAAAAAAASDAAKAAASDADVDAVAAAASATATVEAE